MRSSTSTSQVSVQQATAPVGTRGLSPTPVPPSTSSSSPSSSLSSWNPSKTQPPASGKVNWPLIGLGVALIAGAAVGWSYYQRSKATGSKLGTSSSSNSITRTDKGTTTSTSTSTNKQTATKTLPTSNTESMAAPDTSSSSTSSQPRARHHNHSPPRPAASVHSIPVEVLVPLSEASAVLFDLDGTLVDSHGIWYSLLNAAAKHYKKPAIAYESWKETFGQSMEKNVELFLPGVNQQSFNTFCDQHYADFLDKLIIFDGSLELLGRTKQQYNQHIVLVTNCPRLITELIVQHCKLGKYFKHIICAGDTVPDTHVKHNYAHHHLSVHADTRVLQPKPHPDVLLYACEVLGMPTSKVIFVGDTKYDMQAGREAGCVTIGIGIDTGDVVVNNTRECVKVFEQL